VPEVVESHRARGARGAGSDDEDLV
jgi:hypothetical protein